MNGNVTYTPGGFPERFESAGIVVEYSELGEVQQGSPLVGSLTVNGTRIPGRFGGPPLIARNAVFVPRYRSSEWKFELCRITPETRAVTPLTSPQDLTWPERVDGDILYFYSDVGRTALSQVNLATGELRLTEVKPEKVNPFEALVVFLLVPFVFVFSVSTLLLALFWMGVTKAWSKIKGA